MDELPVLLQPKICNCCKETKRLLDFSAGKWSVCKACTNAKKAATYRKNNPAKRKFCNSYDRMPMEY